MEIRTSNRSIVARKDCKVSKVILVLNHHSTRHEVKAACILNQESESKISLSSVTTYDIQIISFHKFKPK